MEPTSRPAKGFCHGDRGAVRTSRMPIHLAVSQNFSPYAPSRSRSKYRGALSQGNASKSCRAVHSAVGLAVTVFGDCCLRHLDSNLQQFPMNAWSTPSRVGEAHLTNQLPSFRGYGRATIVTPTLPSPIEAKSLAMPGDNGLRLDNEQCRSPIVPQT